MQDSVDRRSEVLRGVESRECVCQRDSAVSLVFMQARRCF